ncbi:L-threonylcarbamoyladenylate synthase [Ideonella sp.]|uniref:L-threonylcarbamoyladenylate synthase n=1 Tax=Ideonella sp. TaxID=1929293 RepID=UPI002B4A9638|nr:L-threonylcarbamoyladenylate synthase [Ideonella sp.]HJV71814.1 L-threonylcarbamoyladenylate synthase [Ideonella sp.]
MPIVNGADPGALKQAAQRLAAGELVAFPTETVYGLGARADDDAAVARIFAAKGRPSDHPLIVHVPDVQAARAFAAEWPERAQRLCDAFWPGPLTVIVPRAPGRAGAAAGGQATIGLRCPAHPVAHALLVEAAALGVPGVAGPSANRFGRVSPTLAAHVAAEFDPGLWVVDGGACEVGIESAIVDCSRDRAVLLRPGTLTRERIEAALGGETLAARDRDAPRASGTLEAHYAPRAKVRLMDPPALRAALGVLGTTAPGATPPVAVYSRTVGPLPAGIPGRAMPADAAAAARALFSALRELDACGTPLIWIETPPADSAWDGVRDRLQRAAAAG